MGVGFDSLDSQTAAQVVSVSGELSDLHVNVKNAPGTGGGWEFQVVINNAGSGVFCTIDDLSTACSDTSDMLVVSAGNTLSVRAIPSAVPAPAATPASWSVKIS
jgi:hypothetical protein